MRAPRAATAVVLLVLAVALIWAPAALAHARLEGTVPQTGSTVKKQPSEVIFKFDQPVGGTDGAVRVYDSEGNEVDDGNVEHSVSSLLNPGVDPAKLYPRGPRLDFSEAANIQ